MSLIKNTIEQDKFFLSGTLFVPMFNKEINVQIEKEADLPYAELCALNLVNLDDTAIDIICQRISDYHKFMLEEWNEEFVREINEKVPKDICGRTILNYIENPTLCIMKPEGDGIGYSVGGYCEWEPEHGIDLIIKDSVLLYVGPQNCLGAWANDDEYMVDY